MLYTHTKQELEQWATEKGIVLASQDMTFNELDKVGIDNDFRATSYFKAEKLHGIAAFLITVLEPDDTTSKLVVIYTLDYSQELADWFLERDVGNFDHKCLLQYDSERERKDHAHYPTVLYRWIVKIESSVKGPRYWDMMRINTENLIK
jgi:hypothetical protein